MSAPHNDSRFVQADTEGLYTLAAYAVYFVWWVATAYGLGSGDPAEYSYICGFPQWFFYSCIVGYPLGCLLVWGLTRIFRHMPLDASSQTKDSAPPLPAATAPASNSTPQEPHA